MTDSHRCPYTFFFSPPTLSCKSHAVCRASCMRRAGGLGEHSEWAELYGHAPELEKGTTARGLNGTPCFQCKRPFYFLLSFLLQSIYMVTRGVCYVSTACTKPILQIFVLFSPPPPTLLSIQCCVTFLYHVMEDKYFGGEPDENLKNKTHFLLVSRLCGKVKAPDS